MVFNLDTQEFLEKDLGSYLICNTHYVLQFEKKCGFDYKTFLFHLGAFFVGKSFDCFYSNNGRNHFLVAIRTPYPISIKVLNYIIKKGQVNNFDYSYSNCRELFMSCCKG